MLLWKDDLYTGGLKEGESLPALKRKIETGWFVKDYYLITSPTNTENLLDIIEARLLRFSFYRSRNLSVFGLAKGKGNAEQLLEKMIADAYEKNGNVNLREYFG